MALTRIVAALVDVDRLTVYKADGTKIEIPQGDVRVKRIIDETTDALTSQGWADVDLTYQDEGGNVYKDVEEKSSGLVRFFRATKKAIASFFNPEKDAEFVEPVKLGTVPVPELKQPIRTMDMDPSVDGKAASTPDKIRDAVAPVKKSTHEAVA